jgi:chemotaxis protein CheZ
VRPFTAERQRQSREAASGPPVGDTAGVLRTLAEMEQRLTAAMQGAVSAGASGAAAPERSPPGDDAPSGAGVETRREIAVLRHRDEEGRDQLAAAALELEAVVRTTEAATVTILESAEAVERTLEDVAGLLGDMPAAAELLSQAQLPLAGIYQASGFQDLTGQRLAKVARTLRFLDDRIARLEAIWCTGGDAAAEGAGAAAPPAVPPAVAPSPAPAEPAADEFDESRLLNGPQMDDAALSQDDIDAMFD